MNTKAFLTSVGAIITIVAALSGKIGRVLGIGRGTVLLLDMVAAFVLFVFIVRRMRRQ